MTRSEAGKLGAEKSKASTAFRAAVFRKRYEDSPNKCGFCGVVLPYKKRRNLTCSHACAAAYTHTGTKRPNRKNARMRQSCVCGTMPSGANKWCDGCITAGLDIRRKTLDEATTDRTRKLYLLRTRPHRCENPACGVETWLGGPAPLEMDHVDGNSDNNTEENLRLLCPNCHALTPSAKGRNRGKGRTHQRVKNERYAAGLKY